MTPQEELAALRRLKELEAKAGRQPDFSNVVSRADTVSGGRVGGLSLAPSANALPPSQSLAAINQGNADYNASPQAGVDAAAQEKQRAALKAADFQSLPAPLRGMIGAGSTVAKMARGFGQIGAGVADYVDPQAPTMAGLITGQGPTRYQAAMQDESAAR